MCIVVAAVTLAWLVMAPAAMRCAVGAQQAADALGIIALSSSPLYTDRFQRFEVQSPRPARSARSADFRSCGGATTITSHPRGMGPSGS